MEVALRVHATSCHGAGKLGCAPSALDEAASPDLFGHGTRLHGTVGAWLLLGFVLADAAGQATLPGAPDTISL
jgi:ketol-acid reductoisomerase